MILYPVQERKYGFLKKLVFLAFFLSILLFGSGNAMEGREDQPETFEVARHTTSTFNSLKERDKGLPETTKRKARKKRQRGIISDVPLDSSQNSQGISSIIEEKEDRETEEKTIPVVLTVTNQTQSLCLLDANNAEEEDGIKINEQPFLPREREKLASRGKEKSTTSPGVTRRKNLSGFSRSKSMSQLPQSFRKRCCGEVKEESLPESKREGKPQIYLKVIKDFIEKSKSQCKKGHKSYNDVAKIIICTSPLFISKEELSSLLTDIKPDFPKQVKGFMKEYTKLKKTPFFNEKPLQLLSAEEFETETPDWHGGNMDDIAKGFTLGHLKLFQSIKFNDIKEYLCGKKPLPTSILGMGERFDNIVEWFALQILREQEEIKRQNLIEKIFILGHSLLQKHNYHGAMQIASLFTKKPIERILSDRQSNTKEWQPIYMGNKHWQAISVLTKLGNNHKTYRDLLAMHPDSPCLPIFPIILKDLACAREYYQEVSRGRMMKGLEWTVSTLETLSRSQSFLAESNENTDCVLKFFWNLPKTSEETLDELSDSIKEWPTLKRKAPQGPLREWDASHLTYVFMENNCKSQVKAFFDRGIYDGAGVVEYMGNIKSEEQNNKLRELGISDIMIDIIISSHEQEVREDR